MKTSNPASAAWWLVPALVAMFFLSGFSGLVYQVLWLRLLALVFGVTVYAASTVLASFMTGLALGSFIGGRLADRVERPVFWYGLAEVLVGASALATPAALRGVEQVYVDWSPALSGALGPLTLLRFVLSFGVLLVPTTLMGATLPIMVKSSLVRGGALGARVGLLYATNTAGAIVGTLLAGLYLIGTLGIAAGFWIAAGVNVLVGIAAMLLSAGSRGGRETTHGASKTRVDVGGDLHWSIPARARNLVLLIFALSGFVSLALELIWFRILVLFVDVTTYAFTMMLATVLAGIAAGSYVITPVIRRRPHWDWLGILAAIELAIGVCAILSLAGVAMTYDVFTWAAPLMTTPLRWFAARMLVASFLVMFPATLLMGIAFPIGLHLWAAGAKNSDIGERIGVFYALNVLGAILGSVVAGFFVLPRLGSHGSLLVASSISVLSGLVLLAALPRARRMYALTTGATGVALFMAAALTMPNPFSVVLEDRYPEEKLLWREEGIQTTVSVHQTANGARMLYLDGLHQANDTAEMVAYHQLVGHLPMALHPNPRLALVIGLGGGATPGAVSMHGGEVDLVELSDTVVRGAEWFRHVNYDVLRRANVRLRVDDGRNYLLLTPNRYDVITADIIQPFHAGAGSLYSAEYYRLARNALEDDGLMVQWIAGSETQYKLIMRTFLSVFPHTTLWAQGSLMVGSKSPLRLDRADFERKLKHPDTQKTLEKVGLGAFETLLGMYTAGPDELRQFVGRGATLSDDQPMVEYFLSLPWQDARVDLSGLHGDVGRHVTR